MEKTILVATHGKAGASGALRVAAAFATRLQATVQVTTVLEPAPVYDYGFGPVFVPNARMEEDRTGLWLEQVREQLRTVVGPQAKRWRVSFRVGSPGPAIAEATRAPGVIAVVMGIGRHSPVDRLPGSETVLHVSRLAPVPVLAVADVATGLPNRALMTTDFSASSLSAARVAMQFMAAGAHVTLAHVVPAMDLLEAGRDEWDRVYRNGVQASATRMIGEIDPANGSHFEVVVLRGDPAEQLVALAHRLPVERIVAGSHGREGLERLFLGSVATKLLRAARCSVLLAPPEPSRMTDGPIVKGLPAAGAGTGARERRSLIH